MHQIPKLKRFSFRLAVVFAQSSEIRCWAENEDVVGTAPTGDAPTISEWSTILLPTRVRLILEVWRCVNLRSLRSLRIRVRGWIYHVISFKFELRAGFHQWTAPGSQFSTDPHTLLYITYRYGYCTKATFLNYEVMRLPCRFTFERGYLRIVWITFIMSALFLWNRTLVSAIKPLWRQ